MLAAQGLMLHELVAARKGEVVARFADEVRGLGLVPRADRAEPVIVDHVEELLDDVVAQLSAAVAGSLDLGQLELRLVAEHDVRDVLCEYGVLITCVLELASDAGQELRPAEVRALARCWKSTIREAVAMHTCRRDPQYGARQTELQEERARLARFLRAREFLSRAGDILASSLDYETTLQGVTALAVPTLADWCIVDLFDEDHRATTAVAVAHREHDKAATIFELRRRHAVDPDRQPPVKAVLHEGRTELVSRVPAEADIADPALRERVRPYRQLGLSSYMMVPLQVDAVIIGAITLAYGSSARAYSCDDIWFAESLGHMVARAIQNARLYSQAQDAIRSREEVLAIVSHDLRNPLNVLRMASVALDRSLDEQDVAVTDLKRKTSMILRSVDRMERLIRDLLDLSRIHAGRLSLEICAEGAAEIAERAHETFAMLAESRHIALRLDPLDDRPVKCDPDRALQVLTNLLDNAAKFTPDGGDVTLGTRDHGEMCLFFVKDNGRGIPESQRSRLFERFWQAEPGARKGAGLGLAISRGIVEAHGGTIGVDSEAGRGTTIWFTLPHADVPRS